MIHTVVQVLEMKKFACLEVWNLCCELISLTHGDLVTNQNRIFFWYDSNRDLLACFRLA